MAKTNTVTNQWFHTLEQMEAVNQRQTYLCGLQDLGYGRAVWI